MSKERKGFSKEILEKMLSDGDTMICVDSRGEDVRVPHSQKDKEDLLIILSMKFRHPIELLEEGIRATLLFGGEPSECWIPYKNLWGAYHPHKGEGYLYPENIPEKIQEMMIQKVDGILRSQKLQKKRSSSGPQRRARPVLKVIPGGRKGD